MTQRLAIGERLVEAFGYPAHQYPTVEEGFAFRDSWLGVLLESSAHPGQEQQKTLKLRGHNYIPYFDS